MQLVIEQERNPRRRAVSFVAGLALNFAMIATLGVANFPAPGLAPGANLSRAILIAPLTARRERHTPPPAPKLVRLPRPPVVPVPQRTETAVHLIAPPSLPERRMTPTQTLPAPVAIAPPPAVVTGTFQSPVIETGPRTPPTTVRAAGFASAESASRAPQLPAGQTTQIGSFGSATPGFATVTQNRAVQTSGFGNAAAGSGSVRSAGRSVALTTGFDTPQPAAPKARASVVPQTGSFHSVEILNKPKPDYTEEARAKRVEGEVWLEVLFGADGSAHVQRVVRSLGYGLDENAIQAARRIRFRPAREGSQEIDQVATVRVQFQLAE